MKPVFRSGRKQRWLALLFCFCVSALAQQNVTVRVSGSQPLNDFKPVWSYFGYDEPNYTYAPNGQKLLNELAALSYSPVHIRVHNLLTSGNGAAALKWGSTNAYTEDSRGYPVYDWSIVDRILNTYVQAGIEPFIEIGFMPEALSIHPEPYRHTFPVGDLFTGWTYPPKDYKKWSDLVYAWVRHCDERFGHAEVAKWNWEVWNEPDIGYWHGTPEEYDKLYDFTADAVKRALPQARVGGPASTGPRGAHAAAFLRQFLEHCTSGRNYATGGEGAPLDFISYHAKGHPRWLDGHVRMGLAAQMQDVAAGLQLVQSFPKWRNLPIVLSESDPEGCAACASPQNAYRNGPLYPVYVAVALKAILALASRNHSNIEGVLTWAFEFEDQPYFAGYRALATNGIDKPVLNVFRMLGLMRGALVQVQSSGAVDLNSIVNSGVQDSDIDALATRSEKQVSVLVWNYRDDDVNNSPASVTLQIDGLPENARRGLLTNYRIDQSHSNAYSVWKQLGSPRTPDKTQYQMLEEAGQLQLLDTPKWTNVRAGAVTLHISLPSESISLLQLRWE